MKGTEQFKEIIKNYLDNRAKEDELFRAKYETTERTIDDVVTYILNEVKQSGCCGFSDMEVFSMAVHAIDELTLEIGKPVNCDVVVNRHIDLTEEEKAGKRHSPSNATKRRSCASCKCATPSQGQASRKRRNNPNPHFLIFKP